MNLISEFYSMITLWEKILLLADMVLLMCYIIYLQDKHTKSCIIEIAPKRRSDAFISTLPYQIARKERRNKKKIAS